MFFKNLNIKILFSIFLFTKARGDFVHIDDFFLSTSRLKETTKFKKQLTELVHQGKLLKNDETYSITEMGIGELIPILPFAKVMGEQWDETWRIVVYEIPESKRKLRDNLRRKLFIAGFRPVHRAFWLSPYAFPEVILSIINTKEEQIFAQAFESKKIAGETGVLLRDTWETDKLFDLYQKLLVEWQGILSQNTKPSIIMSQVIRSYIKVIRKDPGLPSDLLGGKWIGNEVRQLFFDVMTKLRLLQQSA